MNDEKENDEEIPFDPKEFSEFVQGPPKVLHDKKRKIISVSNFFVDCNNVPMKVIASYGKWLEFEKSCLENLSFINFDTVKPFIRPKKNIAELEECYTFYPYEFSFFFSDYYIKPANEINPKELLLKEDGKLVISHINKSKPRGGNPHGRPIDDIRFISIWLYAFLKHWMKTVPFFDELPVNIKEFCNEIGLRKRWDDWDHDQTPAGKALRDTYDTISQRFKIRTSKQSFYKKYVLFRTKRKSYLKYIEDSLKSINYEPLYWLKALRQKK